MPYLRELLFSQEFEEYRKEELRVARILLSDIWNSGKSPDYFRGVMDLLTAIIRIPEKKARGDEYRAKAGELTNKAFRDIEIELLRTTLQD